MESKICGLNKSSCSFCKEIVNDRLPEEFTKSCNITNRKLEESDNFLAFPSISPISLGHILIIPKFHVTSMMQIEQSMFNEFKDFVAKIISLIEFNFDTPIIFEHGIGKDKKGGCGVNHAHLHILPMNSDITKKLHLAITEKLFLKDKINLFEFLTGGDIRNSYLLLGRYPDNMFYCYAEDIPSQYLRKLITTIMGKTLWDWKNMYGWDDFVNTYKILANPNINIPACI